MIKTFNKHIKWREDRGKILICDCKLLRDLFLPLTFLEAIKEINNGLDFIHLSSENKNIYFDFEKLKMLGNLEISPLTEKSFPKAMQILDNELGKERVRDKEFLYEKFKEFPEFFLGVFLDKELIGVVSGFPREDYLLMGELAIDRRFQGRSFGKRLVQKFERITREKGYSKIKVGSDDKALEFYRSLGYKPFLLAQYKKGEYKKKDFGLEIIKTGSNEEDFVALRLNEFSIEQLEELRKKFPKAYFQYIFEKILE